MHSLFRILIAALLLAPLSRSFADEAPPTFAKWEKDIAAFEQQDKENPPPKHAIVFIGSSSIRMWKTAAEDFPHHRVINRGFGGSQLSDAVHFADRIVLPYEPRFIVVYSGGNDINAKKSAEQVFAAFGDFVAKVRAKQPEVPIAYISIAGNPKRWAQVEEVKKANGLIEAFTKSQPGLKFIDVFHPMLGADGLPRPEIFSPDRLHMNAEGYKLWKKIVGRELPAADLK
jgi:lysophospholipase L1-like esterase